MTNTYIINHWKWNDAEKELLETIGYTTIQEKIDNLNDYEFNKLTDYFNDWIMGTKPKARLNYWMKKTGITVEMLNIWYTV